MSKRNINNYILLNFFPLILFSLYFLSQSIFCDTCPNYSEGLFSSDRTNDYNSDSCVYSVKTMLSYTCINYPSQYGAGRKYFAITSDGRCIFSDSCKKIVNNLIFVYGTNECIESCAKINDTIKGDFIQYGEVCMHKSKKSELIGTDIQNTDYELIPNNGYQILKCNKIDYSTIRDRMTFTKCILGKNCPNTYYDSEQHKCLTETQTCENFNKKKIQRSDDNGKIECVTACIHGDYIYESLDQKQCLTSCGDNYYYDGNQKPLKCIEKCEDDDFIDDNTKKCIKACDNGKIFNISGTLHCKNSASCTNPYKFKYSNSCLQSCKETITLFKKETFQINGNECTDNCFQYSSTPYKSKIESDDYKCVACNENNRFIYNLECIAQCPDEAKYHIDDKNECLSKCPNGYYLKDNICYKDKCPDASPYANDSNICVECNNINEGYHIIYGSGSTTLKRCFSKCPPDYLFHNNNDNICYSNKVSGEEYFNCFDRKEAETGSNLKPYFKVDDPYTCYPSCTETGDYKNELEKYHCSKEFDCSYYYYTINSVKTCIVEDYIKTCKNLGFLYLRGKECVPQCNEKEYRTLPVEINPIEGLRSLGKCCEQKEDCGSKFYCNCENKLLRDTCSYKRIKNNDPNNIISSSGGNCVMECPKEYPYENKEGTICNDTNYYQYYFKKSETGNPSYKLIDDCKNINRYHINNSYECIELDKCKIDNNYLYYDDNNICYYSCLGLSNKFAFNSSLSNSQQKCMSSCPQGYYYLENEYICLDQCDYNRGLFYKYDENDQNQVCVEKCEDNQFVLNDNKCVNECPSYMFINTTLIQMGSKYITINKCVDACPTEAKFREEGGKKCLTECSSEGKKFKLGLMCIEKCPEGFYIEENECKTSCDNYYVKNYLDEEKTKYNFQCTQVCDNYTLATKECIEKCPLGENFIGKNKRCKSACENDGADKDDGKYYEKRDTGIQEGIEYVIYACVKNITNMSVGNYLVDGTTQIVDECPIDHPYLSMGERRCYDLCSKSIYYPFTAEYDNGTKVCATECKGSKKYYGEDKICKTQCDNYTFNIINDEDNSCVSECNLNSPYKFKTYKEGRYHCSLQCDPSQPKYTTSNYVCYKDCPAPYNYEYKNECLLKCPENLFSDFNTTIENEDKYNCIDKCTDPNRLYYYRTDLKCIAKCKDEDYEIEDTKECSPFCDTINSVDYHYYIDTIEGKDIKKCVLNCPNAKPFLREDNQCHDSCNTFSYNYYTEDKICKNKCPTGYKIIKEKEDNTQAIFPCVQNCNSSYYLDIDKYCISSCENSYSGNKYFNTYEKICLPSCNKTLYYTEEYECVSSCSEGKFIDDRTCRDFCPNEKRYFVGNYTHGEVNILPNECLYKCPDNYNFISTKTKEIDGNSHILYICLGSCDHYINKEGNNECVESCNEINFMY